MSHIYRTKVKIKEFKRSVAEHAVEKLEQLGFKRASENVIYDFYGRKTRLDDSFAVFELKGLSGSAKNFAVNLETGEILMDAYNREHVMREINEKFQQVYMLTAAEMAIQEVWEGAALTNVEVKDNGELEGVMILNSPF